MSNLNMNEETFKALVIEETEDKYTITIKQRKLDDLPDNDLLIKVSYSSLNYKDALSATGNKGVTRNYPHTPGIDAVGTVVSDANGKFSQGDNVIVTSYDLGMNTDGGFAEYIRVPTEWAVALPEGMSPKTSMLFGTAGFTAAQSISSIVEKVSPQDGEILVTGATGGVGSLSVAILSKIGYRVCAVTGKKEARDYLEKIGADSVITREELNSGADRPMLKPRWAGVVDCVGGDMLTTAIKSTLPLGVITSCGMAASPNLVMTVFPFILRGVSLVGIDSQNCPMPLREALWKKMADEWLPDNLETIEKTIHLEQLAENIEAMLEGKQLGRTLVEL